MQELSLQAMRVTIAAIENEYLQWRRANGFARNTVRNDKSTFVTMKASLGEDFPVDAIDDRAVLRVLEHAGITRSPASVNMIHANMSVLFRWCRLRRYMPVDQDPLMGLRYKKVPKKERRRLSIHEFPAFLNAAKSPRDRMACAVGIYLFLRSSEVASLRVRDIDLAAGTIGVTVHKTGDYDVMPISAELDREIRNWYTDYQEECGPLQPEWYFVPAKIQAGFGTHKLNPTAKISRPEDIVKGTVASYGWTDTHWQGFHLLRASGARAWFDELNEQTIDGALKIVQAHLHHSSVVTTEKYLGLTADRAKRDRLIKGESMFPSLDDRNVIHINRAG